jgi:hypothetical protein
MTGDLLLIVQLGVLLLVIIAVAVGQAGVDPDRSSGAGR